MARTTNVYVPAAVGVPESTPPELSDNPGDRVPEILLNVKELFPPLAVKGPALYAVPTVPLANVRPFAVMVGHAGVVVYDWLPVHPLLVNVAVTVKLAALCEVGVPVIRPLEFIVKPAGSEPLVTANVYPAEAPLANSCWLKDVATVMALSDDSVIVLQLIVTW